MDVETDSRNGTSADEAMSGAATWLRRRLRQVQGEADERMAKAVERTREETDERVRAEAAGGERAKLEGLLNHHAANSLRLEARLRTAEGARADLEHRCEEAERARVVAESRLREETDALRREAAELRAELERAADGGDGSSPDVVAVRMAAEERYAAALRLREEQLEREREEKAQVIERADQRLLEAREQVLGAIERVTEAEQCLVEEAQRVDAAAEERIAAATVAARQQAIHDAHALVRERESELEASLAAARTTAARSIAAAERRAKEAEERASSAERDAAQEAERVRRGAAEWLRRRMVAARDDDVPPVMSTASGADAVSLSTASAEELRGLGMSPTQARRVLRHRARHGFTSVDELDGLPGFPDEFLSDLKRSLEP
jgi:DNA uptake protein ComE-like DNA-binding protein